MLLGNTLEGNKTEINDDPYFYETSYGQLITTREMILDVKAAGFDAIRIPVTWHQKLDENNNISEAWMNRVKEVVDYSYVLENAMWKHPESPDLDDSLFDKFLKYSLLVSDKGLRP